MSKKSRRRNKKILGALAAGLGAMALMRGRGTAQGVSGADKAKFTSDAAYTAPVTGTNYPGANKVAADSTAVDTSKGNTRLKRDGITPGMILNQRRNTPGHGTAVAPPGILNPYRAPRQKLRTFKSGGRVKGVGKAKRGFGRALKGGK